jgi:cytochrome c oxidase subunit 3
MVFGVSASSRGDKAKARKWILATIFFGLAFIVLHLIEWKHLIDEGLRPFSLPAEWITRYSLSDGTLPSPAFGATFFTITGLHMFHVFTGTIYLAVVAARVRKLKHEDVEISGLYWHFVDLVWMFVFPLIYIMSVDMATH